MKYEVKLTNRRIPEMDADYKTCFPVEAQDLREAIYKAMAIIEHNDMSYDFLEGIEIKEQANDRTQR